MYIYIYIYNYQGFPQGIWKALKFDWDTCKLRAEGSNPILGGPGACL